MTCDEWLLCSSSVVTAIATFVIACYAVMSHKLAEANRKMAEELARAAQQMDDRHIGTLQRLAAATLAGSNRPEDVSATINCYRTYLTRIQEHAQATK